MRKTLFVLILAGLVAAGAYGAWWIVVNGQGPVEPPKDGKQSLVVDLNSLTGDLVATKDERPWTVAYTLACISNAAYRDWPTNAADCEKEDLRRWGFTVVQPVPVEDQYAYVMSNDKIVVVAFRGTNDWKDVAKDTWCAPRPWRDGIVHDGFLFALNKVEKRVLAEMRAQGAKDKRIWITGHSLGGAMAYIFAHNCAVEYELPPCGVITFGQPRCFDRTVCNFVNKKLRTKYVRFVNERDIVPWLPPSVVLPFVHSGKRYRLSGNVPYIECTTICAAPAPGAKAVVIDPEPRISEEEYSDLEKRIAKADSPKSAVSTRKSAKISMLDLAKRIPEIHDHLMESYLRSINEYYEKTKK